MGIRMSVGYFDCHKDKIRVRVESLDELANFHSRGDALATLFDNMHSNALPRSRDEST